MAEPSPSRAWGLIGLVAWEFLSYPFFLALMMRWASLRWKLPVWTVAVAGFLGFGIGVWRIARRFGERK